MKLTNEDVWYVDSGATNHMTHDVGDFKELHILDEPITVATSGNSKLWGMGKGTVLLTENLSIEALYVPKLKFKIISVCLLTDLGYEVEFGINECKIQDSDLNYLDIPWKNDGYKLTRKRSDIEACNKTTETAMKSEASLNLSNDLIVHESTATQEPESWTEVMELEKKEREIWFKAMEQEIERFDKSNVWTKTKLPQNKKAIGTRWKYRRKQVPNTSNVKLRARLVAQGFSQSYPEDFDDTYAPVIQASTIRSLLKVASDNNMIVTHIDIDSAFLYSKLDEDIYVKQPQGPWKNHDEELVYKLNKSIYGLKQAAKDWYERITTSISNLNFEKCSQDPCLFIGKNTNETTWVLLHVDDILIISENQERVNQVIKNLKLEYSVKILGDIKDYLGMQFERDNHGNLFMHQEEKITKLVSKMKLHKWDKANTPMKTDYSDARERDPGKKLDDVKSYQSITGSLLYIANTSRPDISYSVNVLTRHNSCPTTYDMECAVRVMKYLQETKHMSLKLGNKDDVNGKDLLSYSDSDWGGERETSRSTSGSLHFLGSSLIGWTCSRQKTVSLSTAEAEYTAVVDAAKEALWLKDLYTEIGISKPSPSTIKCDNQSCIQLAYSYKVSKRVKHIQMKVNFLRELIDKNTIMLTYCNTKDMIADILTKPLPAPKYQDMRKELGLIQNSP